MQQVVELQEGQHVPAGHAADLRRSRKEGEDSPGTVQLPTSPLPKQHSWAQAYLCAGSPASAGLVAARWETGNSSTEVQEHSACRDQAHSPLLSDTSQCCAS